MEDFEHKGKVIEFWKVTGEVLGQNKYSETHVSSSGGGGYVGTHGGHVNAPQVHSSVVTNHEFWIRKDDGSEKAIQLSGHDIPLREGQKITIISAGLKKKNSGYFTIVVNHNANRHWFLNKAHTLNQKMKIDLLTGKSILIAAAFWACFVYLIGLPEAKQLYQLTDNYKIINMMTYTFDNPIKIGGIISAAFIIYRLFSKLLRQVILTKRLNRHLEKLAQAAYKI